ncbi:MAG: heat shock protein HspQ [Candidatus Schekmanbacteria bacterium]|nr:heat shock protein HspQ [Candidatus Schekmanbacteria bacterium]
MRDDGTERRCRYHVGEVVIHVRANYRGVVVRACSPPTSSPVAEAREEPADDTPWYELLLDESTGRALASQRDLVADTSGRGIRNCQLFLHFQAFFDGRYQRFSRN